MKWGNCPLSDRRGVLMIMYDLPVETSVQRRHYARFRKELIGDGFIPVQKSVYIRLIRNVSTVMEDVRIIKAIAPKEGTVHLITLSLSEFESFMTIRGVPFNMNSFSDDVVWI